MPSIEFSNDILKKKYLKKIKQAIDKLKESKAPQFSTYNGNIRTEKSS